MASTNLPKYITLAASNKGKKVAGRIGNAMKIVSGGSNGRLGANVGCPAPHRLTDDIGRYVTDGGGKKWNGGSGFKVSNKF